MFGTGDVFHYVQCAECECLQLVDPPTDWSRYYPDGYYAFGLPPERAGIRKYLRLLRNAGTFTGQPPHGRLLAMAMPYPIHGAENWFRCIANTRALRILDVGCGTGMVVRDLAEIGFTSVLGVDPYIAADIEYPFGARVRKAFVHEIEGSFDLIMLHHSLEHISDQLATMQAIAARLSDDGWCIIRVPTVSSWAWEYYRENWIQLDAPRHFFLHSFKSLERLGAASGLELVQANYDSTELQLTGSELYRRGVPLTELATSYTRAERRRFRRRAEELNSQRRGDQIVCYFRHSRQATPIAARP